MCEPDGPADREYECMERHDAAMLRVELDEQLADESRDDLEVL